MRSTRIATLAVLAGCLGGISAPEALKRVEAGPLPEPVQAEKIARAERRRQERETKRRHQAEAARYNNIRRGK